MFSTRKVDLFYYLLCDMIVSSIAWILFSSFGLLNPNLSIVHSFNIQSLGLLLLIDIGWMLVYNVFDQYKDLYRQSRLAVLTTTFFISLFVVLAVLLLINDELTTGQSFFQLYLKYFTLHFLFTVLSRMVLLTRASRRLKSGKVSFNTLIIGGNENAVDLYKEIKGREKGLGYSFVGFIDSNGTSTNTLSEYLPSLGKLDRLEDVIKSNKIEEVIIAIETSEHDKLKNILNVLFDFDNDILIKVIPSMYDIMLGTVKMNHVYGAVLIEIEQVMMPRWQQIVKRIIDILISLCVLIILLPLYLYIYIRVRMSSSGNAIYAQERIGINGKPFNIIKFRSMYVGAEVDGPALSHENDERCTPWGKVMRKWRIDELPQFWNVLKGEMSIVGPRPERRYYINLIMEHAPHYKHLLKVRPGITSWGQVKYGYASNVEQMLQRLKFDILYIENMSLALDFKIMFYTGLVLIQGKGR